MVDLIAELSAKRLHAQDLVPALIQQLKPLRGREFWSLWAKSWFWCSNAFEHREELTSLFRDRDFAGSIALDDPSLGKHRRFYEGLPESVIVYRGCVAGKELGLSWTLSESHTWGRAAKVSVRLNVPAVVLKARAPKAAVLAAFDDSEEELLMDADKLEILSTSDGGMDVKIMRGLFRFFNLA